MHVADLIVLHAAELLTLAGDPAGPRVGPALAEVGLVTDGAVAAADGQIVAAGPTPEVLDLVRPARRARRIDATGRAVLPGFVDPHTHLIFAGDRTDEFERRLRGASYQEIAAAGGGILSTVAATRAADEETLVRLGWGRLDRMLACGTTTAEAKSGYGLTVDDELKQLRAVHRLSARHDVDLVATLLAAHAVPPEFAAAPDAYVALITDDLLPLVADEDLAEFCDAFCDVGAFTVEQSRAVLEAGDDLGLRPKLHADEFADVGGARLAAELEAISADHLLRASDDGLRAMAAAGVIGVLLPGTAFFLGLPYADARRIIEQGVPVALATDFNPGTSPTWSMPAVIALACAGMKLTPAEAIAAATINAAWAIGLADEVGSLEPGKAADLVILDAPDHRALAMHFGAPLVRTVVKRGRVVVG
ncbi:MAG: imidazolonepropionase [Armatimonadota bacterium]|nr:imidazolonepropionase [Armatimonadota bacterium]MDR7421136.1 imidazolonepropionase [Armatimonadota bacterium]MDR7453451.1 imidazolonepropionase [Armatimonadota bacterium]MDR7457462.1 imidazolonepropionase [Armatimonadota bacterium]MDR7496118.1 imidazolonepropionase [Armatimonadota bacterium]